MGNGSDFFFFCFFFTQNLLPMLLKFLVLSFCVSMETCSLGTEVVFSLAIPGWVVTWFLLGYTVQMFEYTVRTF